MPDEKPEETAQEDQTPQLTPRDDPPERELLIDDVVCCDCGGGVTVFAVPDSVWDGLGFGLGDFACISCVGRRLNPALNANAIRQNPRYWLEKEIWRQRKRFKLVDGQKHFQCLTEHIPTVVLFFEAEEGVTSVSRKVSICRGEHSPSASQEHDGKPVPSE